MPKYQFRFFFSAGSGICFWGADEETKAKYDYPVNHWELPLCENTKRGIDHLLYWYDTSIDWDYPPDPSPWTAEEDSRFQERVSELLKVVKKELGADYGIIDEKGYLQ